MTNKTKNWEKSVDELLHDILSAHDKNDYGERAIGIDNLKQSIQSLLSQRTNEIFEETEEVKSWEEFAYILKKLKQKYENKN